MRPNCRRDRMSAVKKSKGQEDSLNLSKYCKDIVNCLPDLVYILDRNCFLSGCNANFMKLCAVDQIKALLGATPYNSLKTLANWSADQVDRFKNDDIRTILSGEASYNCEEPPIFDKNNEVSFYTTTRIPLIGSDKEVSGLIVILRDITEHKKMEEQIVMMKEQIKAYAKTQHHVEASLKFNEKNPPRVLMVEDNSIAQKAAQSLLMQLDCRVDVADSGDKATALFKPGKYDLVFMDISLEDTSGYIVSKKIRQLEKGTEHHVPIIALTGYEADVVKYDCYDYNMEGALTKPLTSEQARQIIQHYIYHIDIPVSGLKTLNDGAE